MHVFKKKIWLERCLAMFICYGTLAAWISVVFAWCTSWINLFKGVCVALSHPEHDRKLKSMKIKAT